MLSKIEFIFMFKLVLIVVFNFWSIVLSLFCFVIVVNWWGFKLLIFIFIWCNFVFFYWCVNFFICVLCVVIVICLILGVLFVSCKILRKFFCSVGLLFVRCIFDVFSLVNVLSKVLILFSVINWLFVGFLYLFGK